MNTAEQYLSSFACRADLRLATLARELAGGFAGGYDHRTVRLTHEGVLLTHGLTSCSNPYNGLSMEEKVYIAGKLLPLLKNTPADAEPVPTLSVRPLLPRLRGQRSTAPLAIAGTVGGVVPAGTVLLITRDGVQLHRQPAAAGRFSVVDNAPGHVYQVTLSGTGLRRDLVRPLASPVLYGTAPATASAADVAALPGVYAAGRFAFTGQHDRIYVAVPLSEGRVVSLTQPDDNDAELLMAFSSETLTLDFGRDGSDVYQVLRNDRDFLGPFTLDVHLA